MNMSGMLVSLRGLNQRPWCSGQDATILSHQSTFRVCWNNKKTVVISVFSGIFMGQTKLEP